MSEAPHWKKDKRMSGHMGVRVRKRAQAVSAWMVARTEKLERRQTKHIGSSICECHRDPG